MREAEERERMIQEMIEAEKERDPDALDEDIRAKVQRQIAAKKENGNDTTMNTVQDVRKQKQAVLSLGTVLATNIQQQLQTDNQDW